MCCVSFLVPLSVKSEHRFLSSVPDNHEVTNEALFELMKDPDRKRGSGFAHFFVSGSDRYQPQDGLVLLAFM